MTGRKFSTGPWSREYVGGEHVVNLDGAWLIDSTASRGFIRVAYLEAGDSDGIGLDHEERSANARLVSSAPALYDALEKVSDHFSTIDTDLMREVRAALKLARDGAE